jgi:hypothetical protein
LTEAADEAVADPEAIDRTIAGLRPIPQVALKILRMIAEEDYDISEVAGEVRQDQVISAKTLQLCNSAMFARVSRVNSIDQALIRLGQTLFAKLVISASVDTFYNQSVLGYSLCKGGLYRHAIGTAVLAETPGRHHRRHLQGSGLLGRPAARYRQGRAGPAHRFRLSPVLSPDGPERGPPAGHRRPDFQDRPLPGRARTGGKVALPRLHHFRQSRYHHLPEKAESDRELVHIVYLADLLLSRFNAGVEFDRLDTLKLEERLKTLGLTPDRLPEMIDAIPASVFEPRGRSRFRQRDRIG